MAEEEEELPAALQQLLDDLARNALQMLPELSFADGGYFRPLRPLNIDEPQGRKLVRFRFAGKRKRTAEEEEEWRALPGGMQQLLDHLARKAFHTPPPLDLDLDDAHRYFRPSHPLMDEGRYWGVRMRVLTAMANCRSLVSISLSGGYRIGEKREEEVLVLLRGLASNPVLRLLNADWCPGFGRQAACVALGQLVACSRSLRQLSLRGVGLKAAGLGALAEGFSEDSVLEELDLSENKVGDAGGAQQLALILATAPKLRHLGLKEIGMDVAGAEMIASALPRCATLQFLGIAPGYPGYGKVEDSSSSVLGPVSTLLKLAFTKADEHGSVFAAGITTLELRIAEEDAEAGLADALAGMLRTNDCIQRLWTTPHALNHGLEALRHNSTIFELRLPAQGMLCEEKVWMRLVPLLQQCKALRTLHLDHVIGHASFKKALLKSLRDNESLSELSIHGWNDLGSCSVADLMHSILVNRTLLKVIISRTSWEWYGGEGAPMHRALARNRFLARNPTQQP